MRNGPGEPPARPDPPKPVECFRRVRVGRTYSHRRHRRFVQNADVRRTTFASILSEARARCERRERASDGWLIQQPVKARAARGAREQDHGGGQGGAERRRARRAGTRSGYGSTGGRGFLCGAGADRGAGAVAVRNPHYAKSIFKHLLMGYRAAVRRSFISPYSVGDRR